MEPTWLWVGHFLGTADLVMFAVSGSSRTAVHSFLPSPPLSPSLLAELSGKHFLAKYKHTSAYILLHSKCEGFFSLLPSMLPIPPLWYCLFKATYPLPPILLLALASGHCGMFTLLPGPAFRVMLSTCTCQAAYVSRTKHIVVFGKGLIPIPLVGRCHHPFIYSWSHISKSLSAFRP